MEKMESIDIAGKLSMVILGDTVSIRKKYFLTF